MAHEERELEARHPGLLRRAIEAERRSVAHDLHDLVSYGVTLSALTAGTATVRTRGGDWPAVGEALGALERSLAQTRVELSRLVGALELPATPVADLEAVVGQAREAGQEVTLDAAALPGLPAALSDCVVRSVQEALTNSRRHAGAPPTRVTVRAEAGAVVLAVSSAPALRPSDGPGTGRGLAAMRDRAQGLGGDATAGPLPDGGYEVTVRLPLLGDVG